MPALRSLPPQFLLPAWNVSQLYQLGSLQQRSLHVPANSSDGTEGKEQVKPLKKPGTNKPLIKKSHKRPTGNPAGRPPKKSATAFTSLRRIEPRVVLPVSVDRDAVQKALLDEDRRAALNIGTFATRNKETSSSKRRLTSSTEDRKREPGSQDLFRKVECLQGGALDSGGITGASEGWRSPAKRGGEAATFRVHPNESQQASRRDRHERAGPENESSYADTKKLESRSKSNYNDSFSASNHQQLKVPTGSWGKFGDQTKSSDATSRGIFFSTTEFVPRVPLKIPKEVAQIPAKETTTKVSPGAPIRSAQVPAPLKNTQQPAVKKPSLFEELFPEEARQKSKMTELEPTKQADLPHLPPLDFDVLPESLDDFQSHSKLKTRPSIRGDTSDSFCREEATILVLSRASTSLSEADFRRVVPTRGEHIEGWRGPGDILKVIPARDMATLSPRGHYFLLFPNLAYAQAYQNHVIRLHRLAQTQTRTSLDWGLSVSHDGENGNINSEDIPALLQDYTLSPPSVRLTLRLLDTPYRRNIRKVLDHLGYPNIVTPDNKAGRSVLFWVNGYQPSTLSVKTMLAKDGQDRGLQWGPLKGCGSIDVFDVKPGEDDDEEAESEVDGEPDKGRWEKRQRDEELKPKKNWVQRWVISFEDEAEARRFVRVWHQMPYMFPLQTETASRGEENMLVQAEFLW